MWMVPYAFQGTTYHLLMNAAALFDIYEAYGSKGFVTDHIRGTGKKSFQNTCFFLAKLAEQGELYRRYQGYDKGPIPTQELFLRGLSPTDVPQAKKAIAQAVEAGFSREEAPEQKEIDVGLLELQKKTNDH